MSKIKTFFKKPVQAWRHIFGFLPIISLGGTALILSTFAIAPNFINFAHAEENTALKPSEIKLSMSVDETFHKFNDVYLTSDGVEHEAQNNVTFKPTVETNNPAGYKVYFSDVDEDTSMRTLFALPRLPILRMASRRIPPIITGIVVSCGFQCLLVVK